MAKLWDFQNIRPPPPSKRSRSTTKKQQPYQNKTCHESFYEYFSCMNSKFNLQTQQITKFNSNTVSTQSAGTKSVRFFGFKLNFSIH